VKLPFTHILEVPKSTNKNLSARLAAQRTPMIYGIMVCWNFFAVGLSGN
jgi:hypothetical protein